MRQTWRKEGDGINKKKKGSDELDDKINRKEKRRGGMNNKKK